MTRSQVLAAVWQSLKDGPELAAIECRCQHKKARLVVAAVDAAAVLIAPGDEAWMRDVVQSRPALVQEAALPPVHPPTVSG